MKKGRQQRLKKQKLAYQKYKMIRVTVFFLAMAFFAVAGILIPLRPKTSDLEKRELTRFPSFSLSDFWNGTFFSGIETWYGDTFPMRESLLSANAFLKELHGLRSKTVVISGNRQKGEQIPQEADADQTASPQTDPEETVLQTEAPLSTEEADGSIHEGVAETFGDVYIVDGQAFEAFYFVKDYGDRYCRVVNTLQEKAGQDVSFYVMAVPVNSGIILDEKMQEQFGFSNQKEAAEYLYKNLDSRITAVDVYNRIKRHNSEYVYFRTDHHWTSLGAYYAYCQFAETKGLEPASLDSFEKKEFPGFLGSFYSSSQASVLKEHPDTVTAYFPKGTNDISITDQQGTVKNWKIIGDVSDYQENNLYCTFIGGDNPYSEIHNPNVTDGSSLLVFKESYANCFIPFLTDHYQDIYIIDYRYYQGDLPGLIRDKSIDEVLFLNNLNSIFADNLLKRMEQLVL